MKADLDQDVHLGINEPVSTNTRMVILPKNSGDTRRTVDFKAFNDALVRQTHLTQSEFKLLSEVPRGTIRSVLEFWYAYYSVPIRGEDLYLGNKRIK